MDEPVEQIVQFFRFDHLPLPLQQASRPFAELAEAIVRTLPRSAERTVALRKLLESKDAAVRAALSAPQSFQARAQDEHSAGPEGG